MLVAGLTGGLATGKSFVGRSLESMGCHVVRADTLGHQALSRNGGAFESVVAAFGDSILGPAGEIDRRELGRRVFRDPERLKQLNSLVHPHVFRMEEEFLEAVSLQAPQGIAIIEAAILVETGRYKRLDRLIVTVCPEEQQISRAMERDGLTKDEVLERLRRQMPLSEKRKFADFVIDTSGSKEDTLLQTRKVYESLRRNGL